MPEHTANDTPEAGDAVFSEIMQAVLRVAFAAAGDPLEGASIAMAATTKSMQIVREMAEVCSRATVGRLHDLGWIDQDVADRKDLLAAYVHAETDLVASALAHQFADLVQYRESLDKARVAMAGAFAVVGGKAADRFDAGLRESAGMKPRTPPAPFALPEGFLSQHLGAAMSLALVRGCVEAFPENCRPVA